MKMSNTPNPKLPNYKLHKHEQTRHDPPPSPERDELRRLRAQGRSPHVPRSETHEATFWDVAAGRWVRR